MKLTLNRAVRALSLPIALAAVAATPAHAQANLDSQYEEAEQMQLRFGLVIPFGSSGQSTELKPRLALSIVRQHDSRQMEFDWRPPTATQTVTEFGLTLDSEPTFTLDGKPLQAPEQRSNLSAGAAVAIGAATLVALIAIAAAETSDSLKSALGND